MQSIKSFHIYWFQTNMNETIDLYSLIQLNEIKYLKIVSIILINLQHIIDY